MDSLTMHVVFQNMFESTFDLSHFHHTARPGLCIPEPWVMKFTLLEEGLTDIIYVTVTMHLRFS